MKCVLSFFSSKDKLFQTCCMQYSAKVSRECRISLSFSLNMAVCSAYSSNRSLIIVLFVSGSLMLMPLQFWLRIMVSRSLRYIAKSKHNKLHPSLMSILQKKSFGFMTIASDICLSFSIH